MPAPPPCVAIDFETAGYYGHSACALGMARVEHYKITDSFYSLIRPPSPDVRFTHIHGLVWNDLKDAPSFPEVWQAAEKFLRGAEFLMAHNAPFDRRVLGACRDAFGLDFPERRFLCTLKGAHKAFRPAPCSLGDVCGYFGIELDHHNAGSDARGCARIYINLLKLGLGNGDMLLKS